MSKLWDDLKHNMKEWSTAAVEKAEEVSKMAVAKTEELTRISKIKFEIHQLQRDLAKAHENLGQLVANYAKEENMVNFTGHKEFYNSLQKLDEIKAKIDNKEREIDAVKEELELNDEEIAAIPTDTDNNAELEPEAEIAATDNKDTDQASTNSN